MDRFDISVSWKILCFQRVKCLSQVLVVRQDLKMKSGKIASQCARKILKLLLILWCSIWLQFFISSGPVLPVSLHSAVNSCFFFFWLNRWLNIRLWSCRCCHWHVCRIDAKVSLFWLWVSSLCRETRNFVPYYIAYALNFQASDCQLDRPCTLFYIFKSYSNSNHYYILSFLHHL